MYIFLFTTQLHDNLELQVSIYWCLVKFHSSHIVLSNYYFGLLFPISLCRTALHKVLYCKDCITLRQPWLFCTKKQKQKQDKMKLENI